MMLDTIKSWFGIRSTDYRALMARKAVIVDVRTPGEYASGHIRGSVNIPLDRLQQGYKKLKTDRPVITCCASGMRSGSAKGFLAGKGYEVVNGGGWHSLNRKLENHA